MSGCQLCDGYCFQPEVCDDRQFYGHAPTHCTICGSRWETPCKPWCINAPVADTTERPDRTRDEPSKHITSEAEGER